MDVRYCCERADVDGIVDDDRPLGNAAAGADAQLSLVLGDTDHLRRQRLNDAVGPQVEPSCKTGVGGEGPAVRGEDSNRDTGEHAGDPAENAGLGAVRVQDFGSLAPAEPDEFDERKCVAERVDPAPEVFDRHEPHTRGFGGVAHGTVTVRRDRDLELLGDGGDEQRDVGLRAAGFRQRDQQQEARTPALVMPRLRLARPLQAPERANDEVGRDQEEREQDRQRDRPRVAERVERAAPARVEECARAQDDVPSVPALDPAEVDPEGAQREHRDDERPRPERPYVAAPRRVHEQDGREAEEQPGPGGCREEEDVEEDRDAVAVTDVLQVGDQVRRVR